MLKHLKVAALSAVLLVAAGCASTVTPVAVQTASAVNIPSVNSAISKTGAYSCATAAAAISVLASNVTKLSVDQRTQVSKAVGAVDPVCNAPTPPTVESLSTLVFKSAMDTLLAVQNSLNK